MNSTRTHIVDLDDRRHEPGDWDHVEKPSLARPEDISIYELHVRDFSIFDETVPASKRGTFAAFTKKNSDGMQHLSELAEAGLSHVHLLPVFDIATIDEDATQRVEPDPALLATVRELALAKAKEQGVVLDEAVLGVLGEDSQ